VTQQERTAAAVPLLLDWYARSRRPLPWREEPTPYRVWISEIMLQQTRIEAVLPYYERFLARLPDVAALAAVEEEELLKLWEGLGYYSRARNLKKAAQQVMAECGGQLPRTAAELKKLPGIGDYTAGAIASIACGQPEPAVDGNVLRVLMRLWNSDEDVLQNGTKKRVTELLRGVYPSGAAAAQLTEGLMELGETLCLPGGEPQCGACPLASLCLAREAGRARLLPVRSEKKPRRVEERTVLLLLCGEKYAICRRGDSGLLAGLWELPNLDGRVSEEAVADWLRTRGAQLLSCEGCGEAKHIFSHVEWRMTGWRVRCDREAEGLVWKTAAEIRKSYAIPAAFRAYTQLL